MFFSQPYITKNELISINKTIKKKFLSKFVGTLTKDTKKYLNINSIEARKNLPIPNFLGGPMVRECEYRTSIITGSKYSVLFNSASSALLASIKSLGLKRKSYIAVPAVSFSATISAIVAADYIPVICDIDASTTMCPNSLLKAINKFNIKAVVFVQWCGNQGNIFEVARICKKNKIKLIEDSSQATLTKTSKNKYNGTFGDIGVFSFNEPKNLSSGEGGMAITNKQKYAKSLRLTRNHGEAYQVFKDYDSLKKHFFSGYNLRPTEYCAAIIIEQIKRRNKINLYRIKNYKKILEETKNIFHPICNYKNYTPYAAGFFLNPSWKIDKFQLSKILFDKGYKIFTSNPIEHWMLFKGISKKLNLKNLNFYKKNYICFFQIGYPVNLRNIVSMTDEIKKIYKNQHKYLKIKRNYEFNTGRK